MVMMIFITIILDFVLSNITLKTLLNSLLFTITSLILKKALLGKDYNILLLQMRRLKFKGLK